MRVITYDISFVEGGVQPSAAKDWEDRSKSYQSPFTGERTFSFTAGTLEIDVGELLTRIRRHFYAVVLKGEASRNRSNAHTRMMDLNTATRRYNLDDDSMLVVYNVHHVRVIDKDDSWELRDVLAEVRYRGNILNTRGDVLYDLDYKDRYIRSPHVYSDGRTLLGSAVNDFRNPQVQKRIIDSISVA
jgi:hypothetical protein